MAKINVMLMAFILIGFTVFKLLFFTGTADLDSGECGVGALSLTNCFIEFKTDCNGLIDDGAVCLNLTAFSDALNIDNSDCGGIFDVGACIEYLANVIFAVVKLVVSIIIAVIAFIINIILLVVIYLSIGLTPIPPPCPFVVNLLLIGPFILGNAALVASFFTGD